MNEYPIQGAPTPFSEIYDRFFGKITDDMYFEWTPEDTQKDVKNILAILMYNVWLQRQIASVENIRQKYTGTDFKMTSQASHLLRLTGLKQEAERQDHHMQRLYKRRKLIDNKGSIKSNWSTLIENTALDD